MIDHPHQAARWQGRFGIAVVAVLIAFVLYNAWGGGLVASVYVQEPDSEQALPSIAITLAAGNSQRLPSSATAKSATPPPATVAISTTNRSGSVVQKNIAVKKNTSNPVRALFQNKSSKVFVLGFAKTGTISLSDYFACGGLRVSHWYCGKAACGDLIMSNLQNNLPPLNGSEMYQVYAQLDNFKRCKFPQLEFEKLDQAYPGAIFILNTRPLKHWLASLVNWKEHRLNLVECDLPGLPSGVGVNDSDVDAFIAGHFRHVRDYFAGRPGKLVEVDIENTKETSVTLEQAFGISKKCYGHHHGSQLKNYPQMQYLAEKMQGNPIIYPELLPSELLGNASSSNINGPSIIRVPRWVKNAHGKYYLYFASHTGQSIRLAYAEKVQGPWTVLPRGVLDVSQVPQCHGHMASPDVIILDSNRTVRMYFHCLTRPGTVQETYVSHSINGLNYVPSNESLGPYYFRAFQLSDEWWAVGWGGILYRSKTGINKFKFESDFFRSIKLLQTSPQRRGYEVRHSAVLVEEDHLLVVYSYIGDNPERIYYAKMPLPITTDLKPLMLRGSERELLRPTEPWEGADLPSVPSKKGPAPGRTNAVRDPALFKDSDGQRYIFYSVAGENGIAVARLSLRPLTI